MSGPPPQHKKKISQKRLAQSKVLQDWWNKSGNSNQHPTPEELIEQIRAMSQYLGDEVVITFRESSHAMDNGPVLLAEIRRPGLKDFLQNHLADTLANHQGTSEFHVVD